MDERFRFISALEVIEHMTDTDAFLRDCYQHLDPCGYLVLTTPNINSFRNRVMIPLGKYPTGLEYRNVIHHVRLYNVSMLRKHLQEHGFVVKCIRGVSFLPNKILRRNSMAVLALEKKLANHLPQFCNNIIVIACKI